MKFRTFQNYFFIQILNKKKKKEGKPVFQGRKTWEDELLDRNYDNESFWALKMSETGK